MGAAAPELLGELRERYVELLIAGEARGAHALVAEALRAAPVEAVYRELVTEALHEVGDRWERGEVTVAEEHLASGICETSLPDLAERLPRLPRRHRTAIVACVPWELHALGARIVSDFLEAGGWEVLHLGALVPASVLAQLVVARNADVVALSATTTRSLGELGGVCARLHALPRSPVVAAGGQALLDAPVGFAPPGAVVEHSPEALVKLLAERFPAERPQG
jgi:MerR family transcriptional regulator, light-induced transcriptional regulator